MRRLLLLAAALLAIGATDAQAHRTVWLCRPGIKANPCATSRAATAIDAAGTRTPVPAPAARRPPVDCFYVYPTVSNQKTVNANLAIDPEERAVATIQASRFSQVCRVFAPMYRQVTRAAISGQVGPLTLANRDLALGDLRAAWRDYLRRYNHGRGVVLIGHSQGSFMLVRLIAADVDPKPSVRRRLISAILPGTAVQVPAGKPVGGSFEHVPACRSFTQTGCVVAYSSFDRMPPADSRFGRIFGNTGMRYLCVNPAAPGGGVATLQPFFLSTPAQQLSTPWVTYPGLYRAHCTFSGGASWLQVDPVDVGGRPVAGDPLGPRWGLHLVDVNIALGNLVELVRRESAAWLR
jgi:hypothetical protein